jgi:hypothetical protein
MAPAQARWPAQESAMRRIASVTCLGLAAFAAFASDVSPQDRAAIFEAAGFKPMGANWTRCEEEPRTASYSPGAIELEDLDGDGKPEAWVRESSTFCYGAAGEHFALLRRDATGWHVVLESDGMFLVRDAQHAGWPDIEVGGPGFDSVVYRWNGKAYGR